MRIGRKRRALPSLEIHDVCARHAPTQRPPRLMCLLQKRQIDAEAAIGLFRSRHRLEDEIDRRTAFDCLDGRRYMAKATGLCRDRKLFPQFVEQGNDADIVICRIGRGIDANHGISRAHQQPVDGRRYDTAAVIGRVVGLVAGGKPPGEPDRVAESRHDTSLGRNSYHVLQAHDLRNGRDHFRRQSEGHRLQPLMRRLGLEQPFAEFTDSKRGNCGKGCRIVPLRDQSGNFVILRRNEAPRREMLSRGDRPAPSGLPSALPGLAPQCRPAWSPERSGVAFASSIFRSSKRKTVCSIVVV